MWWEALTHQTILNDVDVDRSVASVGIRKVGVGTVVVNESKCIDMVDLYL